MQQALFEINRKKSDAQREGKYIPQKKKKYESILSLW